MIALLVATLLSQETTTTEGATVAPAAPEVKIEAPPAPPPLACARWKAPGLFEGPAVAGYGTADFTLGRRACPRSELGIGANFGAIIDTPNFYGNVGLQALLFGSYALNEKTELFAYFAAYDFEYTVNAVISGTKGTVGDATVGLSRQVYQTGSLAGAVSARLLLPTASNIPGTRNTGAEVGHSVSLRATSWLEAHGYLGVGFTVGLGPAPLPALILAGTLGVALSPVSWFSFVLDVSGGLAGRSFFAPTGALRFRLFKVGIELAATRPLLGSDRHDVIGALRVGFRF